MEKIEEKLSYCLNCKTKPCSKKGCPLGNDIPKIIELTKQKNYKEAYRVLSETTVLPGICGKICPHSKQCQGSCVRGINGKPVNIGEIEEYVFKKAVENKYSLKEIYKEKNDKELNKEETILKKESIVKEGRKKNKVAIIGGGPSGLTCATFLKKEGIEVTIYEKYNELGGILTHGIPEFRLDKTVIKETINRILDLGIEVKYNQILGENLQLRELEKEYDAIFLSVGANKSIRANIEGEELEGIYGGNELLETKKYPNFSEKKVAIIGGGNVAMDCSRTIKRLRSKRSVCYIQKKRERNASRKRGN